jgi:peptide/nickel transport system substrate-binding protein
MSDGLAKIHSYLPTLLRQFRSGKLDRREFLRSSTLLGLSAAAAYGLAGCDEKKEEQSSNESSTSTATTTTQTAAAPAENVIRVGMRVPALDSPHTFSWVYDSNVVRQVNDYLTRTGVDNITRPWLLEKWEASADLKTWTLVLKKGIKWSNGDELKTDDVIWNIKRWLDESVGSSVVGLMKGYMLTEYDTGQKDDAGNPKMGTKLWADNAVEKVDDYTIRLNCKEAQLAVPEHLFHYPALILHPSENGKWGVNSIGTGAFTCTEIEVGKKAVMKRRDGYWGTNPAVESIEFIDLGDDPAASVSALASKQIHGLYEASTSQYAALQKMDHINLYQISTGQTAVARMQPIHDTWKDPKVRKAMRLAIDTEKVLQVAHLGLGSPGEHHHVCPIHPEYAKLDFMKQDIEAAKKLLADAGKPDGFETEIFCKKDPDWEPQAVQAMAEMWKQIGVNVKINVLPSSQYWEIWNKETAPFAFTTWTHRPLGVMVLGLAYRSGVPWNESFYSNPDFDSMLTKAEGILDVEERRKVMADLEKIMQEDGPIVQPLWRAVFTGFDKRVKGFQIHPTYYLFCEEWSLTA